MRTLAFPLKQFVPCLLCTILILLSIMSFSHAKAKPSKCQDSGQDPRSNYTIEGTSSEFYLIDKESGLVRTVDLNFLRNLSGSEHKKVFSAIEQVIPLWRVRPGGLCVDEASFSVTIVYQPLPNQRPSGIAFLIIPSVLNGAYWANNNFPIQDDGGSLYLQGTTRNANISGSSVSVAIGALKSKSSGWGNDDLVMAVDINIDAAAAFTYAVWIDYDRVERRLSAYVDVEGAGCRLLAAVYHFGLLSTVAQQLNVRRWNATVENLPWGAPTASSFKLRGIPLFAVLGSVAMTVMMATTLTWNINSRYRRWHRDLDQLARSIERLPGVPIEVEFADIKKATGNFHETMKLGGSAVFPRRGVRRGPILAIRSVQIREKRVPGRELVVSANEGKLPKQRTKRKWGRACTCARSVHISSCLLPRASLLAPRSSLGAVLLAAMNGMESYTELLPRFGVPGITRFVETSNGMDEGAGYSAIRSAGCDSFNDGASSST